MSNIGMTDPTPEPTPVVPVVPPVPVPPAPVAPGMLKNLVAKNWRQVVGWIAVFAATVLANYFWFQKDPLPYPEPPIPIFQGEMGWHEPTAEDRAAVLKMENVFLFEETEAGQANGIFGDADGNAFNGQLADRGSGSPIPVLDQGPVGSCVGHGWADAVNKVLCIMAHLKRGPPIEGRILIPAEVIYAGSRVNANGGRSPLLGDGSNGSWAAKFVTGPEGGVCNRGVYGPYDVSRYDENNCRTLGRVGVKGELLAECKKNIVSAALVTSAADAKKALLQGYMIAICSDVGYAGQSSRDADGFLKASGRWGHCMSCEGYRADKDAFLIMNSWGANWVKGPKGPGEPPDGSFWITSANMDRMLRQQDSYVVSGVKGFPKQKLNPDDWMVARPKSKKSVFENLMLNAGGIYAVR